MYLLLTWVVFYTLVNWIAAIYLFCFSPEGVFIGQLSPFDMLCMLEYDYDVLSKENGIILSVSFVLALLSYKYMQRNSVLFIREPLEIKEIGMKHILTAVLFGTIWLLLNLDDETVRGIIFKFPGGLIVTLIYIILIFVAYAYLPRFDGRTKTGYKDNIKPGFFGWVVAPLLCLLSPLMILLLNYGDCRIEQSISCLPYIK